jgi:CDP-glucose 4,6-dehydratase
MTEQSSRPALTDCALGRAYGGRRVLVTGHTGFKGSWLCEWLLTLGAQVTGFSLAPDTNPALFDQLGLAERLDHRSRDIRDLTHVMEAIEQVQPDFVFHLAAQPLVRRAYREPLLTYQTNVIGTVHLLEALRSLRKPCAAVFVTSDKAYENKEWVFGYREDDALGGFDPYSSSKAAAEIAITAWRRSFFPAHPVRIASARAGNVIGGGDWSEDRIVPDCIRALRQSQRVPVRNKRSQRHWQHVLEPLSGYLWLAAALHNPALANCSPDQLPAAFNFGPSPDSNRPVVELVQEVLKHWPGEWEDRSDPNAVHEAGLLQLCTDKAYALLAWRPAWEFAETIQHTVGWYHAAERLMGAKDFRKLTLSQIEVYCQAAAARRIAWAKA